jgi:hypothetical protein
LDCMASHCVLKSSSAVTHHHVPKAWLFHVPVVAKAYQCVGQVFEVGHVNENSRYESYVMSNAQR